MNTKTTRYILFAIIVAIVLIGGFIVFQQKTKNYTPYRPKADTSKTPAPSSQNTAKTQSVNPPAPIPQTSAPAKSSDGKIVVASPTAGGTVSSGSTVNGSASTRGGKLYYTLKGKQSGQLASGVVQVALEGQPPSNFSFQLDFTNGVSQGDQGVLEVYGLSATGAQENSAVIGVNLR